MTALHKANVCKQSDGLFLRTFYDVAEKMDAGAHGLQIDDNLADSCLTRMVQAPSEFDVLCCPNLYGDLVRRGGGGGGGGGGEGELGCLAPDRARTLKPPPHRRRSFLQGV